MLNLQLKVKKSETVVASEREKDAPQPSHALQEFVKHIANPLVDKGWNFAFKIWKRGAPGGAVLSKALPHGSPQLKLTKKKKLVNLK